MTTHKTECTYCQLVVDAPTSEHEQPPGLTDDSAWDVLAEQHAPTCEWILTRAHRLNETKTRLVCMASVNANGGFWFVGELRSDNRVYFKRRDGSAIDASNSRDWLPIPAGTAVKAGDIIQRW